MFMKKGLQTSSVGGAGLTRRRLRPTLRDSERSSSVHVRVKRALHVRGANSFRPFQLTPPKGKVSGSETRTRKERVCRPFSELVRMGGGG